MIISGTKFHIFGNRERLHLRPLKRDDHDFVSYREILDLLLKKSVTTTDEPLRDSNSINSINIHNDSNKSR